MSPSHISSFVLEIHADCQRPLTGDSLTRKIRFRCVVVVVLIRHDDWCVSTPASELHSTGIDQIECFVHFSLQSF